MSGVGDVGGFLASILLRYLNEWPSMGEPETLLEGDKGRSAA